MRPTRKLRPSAPRSPRTAGALRSGGIVLVATVAAVALAYVLTGFVPDLPTVVANDEVTSRTAPNLLDLAIAVAAGLSATLSGEFNADYSAPGSDSQQAQELIEDTDVDMPDRLRDVFHEMCTEIRQLEERIRSVEGHLGALAAQTPAVRRLQSIPGVGLLTATAMAGFVGDVGRFRSSRPLREE